MKTKKNLKNNKTKKLYPKKYIPKYLSNSNAETIKKEIDRSQKMYKKGKYYIRKNVSTMKIKPSKHVLKAKKK